MVRFYIIDGLPYLIGCNGDTFTVRLNDDGYTVGEKVTLPEIPTVTYSELSVRAKCEVCDSIKAVADKQPAPEQTQPEPVADKQPAPEQTQPEPVADDTAKKGRRQRKKAVE